MKAVVQRVSGASASVGGIVKGSIGRGLLVYLGVAHNDAERDADWLAEKAVSLRIFDDAQGKMNLSLNDIKAGDPRAGVLAVSQFTLLGDARKGRRPSWAKAAPPEKARGLYERFIKKVREQAVCESGEFQADMQVACTNDGPVTILLDSAE